MKKINEIRFDHPTKRIIITKDFAKRANTPNSKEYRQLQQAIKDFPLYSVEYRTIAKNNNRKTHSTLTIDFMETHINKLLVNGLTDQETLAEFNRVKDFYKGTSSYYPRTKAWFLSKFKDYKSVDLDNAA